MSVFIVAEGTATSNSEALRNLQCIPLGVGGCSDPSYCCTLPQTPDISFVITN